MATEKIIIRDVKAITETTQFHHTFFQKKNQAVIEDAMIHYKYFYIDNQIYFQIFKNLFLHYYYILGLIMLAIYYNFDVYN